MTTDIERVEAGSPTILVTPLGPSCANAATGLEPARCPLCGRENECGAVKGTSKCWCFYVGTIPEEVLERVPLAARGEICICETCATGRSPTGAL